MYTSTLKVVVVAAVIAGSLVVMQPTAQAESPSLVVHEWGVWVRGLTPQGRDELGPAQELVADLPTFVLRTDSHYTPVERGHGWDKPVLHFYGPEGLRVRVRIDTPLGRPTAYWPKPALFEQKKTYSDARKMWVYDLTDVAAMEWSGRLSAEPKHSPAPPPAGHWWSRVRQVPGLYFNDDAASERFLFYEATARRWPTVTAELTGETMTLLNSHNQNSGPVVVIVNDGQDRWAARAASVPANGEVRLMRSELSNDDGAASKLLAMCRAQWVTFGMTEDEAAAIVATWEPDLLNSVGVLVISRMPRDVYDKMFPLTISPQPAQTVRVGMVFDALAGQRDRAEWLPGLSATLEQLGLELGDEKYTVRAAARQRLSRMGNLVKPRLEQWVKSDDVEVAATARTLLQPIKAYESARRVHDAWKEKSREVGVLRTSPEQPVE